MISSARTYRTDGRGKTGRPYMRGLVGVSREFRYSYFAVNKADSGLPGHTDSVIMKSYVAVPMLRR